MQSLPRDVVRLLMTRFFSGCAAIRCLSVARMFGRALLPGDQDIIWRKAVIEQIETKRTRSYSDKLNDLLDDEWMVCKECDNTLKTKNLRRHRCNPRICQHCGVISPGHVADRCPLLPDFPCSRLSEKHKFITCEYRGYRQQVLTHCRRRDCALTCKYCHETIKLSECSQHGSPSAKCANQRYGCWYNCGEVLLGKEFDAHVAACGRISVMCPGDCGKWYPRQKLSSKYDGKLYRCDLCAYAARIREEQTPREISTAQATIALLKRMF